MDLINKISSKLIYYPDDLDHYYSQNSKIYNDIHSPVFNMDSLIYYILVKDDVGVIDELINTLYDKFIDDSLFYTPELCIIITYKNYYKPIEDYILDCCINRLKFSIRISWIISSCSSSEKIEKTQQKIEMTLVNGRRATMSNFTLYKLNKSQKESDVFEKSMLKEKRLFYFDFVLDVYEKMKDICDELFNVDKSYRNNKLRNDLEEINKSMKALANNNKIDANNLLFALYKGIILPFNDYEKTTDECCNLIVNILPHLSFCFNTKARVPIKVTVECVRAEEMKYYDKLYQENTDNNDIITYKSIKDFMINYEKNETIRNTTESNLRKAENILNMIKTESPDDLLNKSIANMIKKHDEKSNDTTILPKENIVYANEIFGEKFSSLLEKTKKSSNYKNFQTYSLKSFIVKSNDDLRQEAMAMQLIKKVEMIFNKSNIPIYIKSYEILATSPTSGIIEFLDNTISIDSLKHKLNNEYTLDEFFYEFFGGNYDLAQKNFCSSLAGYSLLTYFLEIKDRHNGNILIDLEGHVIHIDYGFILGISPGNLNFENAPFKLTSEYIKILGGTNNEMFLYFRTLLLLGFKEIRKYYETLWQIIEINYKGQGNLPCFNGRNLEDIKKRFRGKFKFDVMEIDENFICKLIGDSLDNWRTIQYDNYQYYSNGIL